MSEPRTHWSSNFGFVLAATGSAIGLGNLWKFPYITWQNEGGAFVLVYLVCIAAVGLPIMIAEILIGRRTQKGPVSALAEVAGPPWKWVGVWGVLAGFSILSFYLVVAGWSIYYFVLTVGWSLSGFPAGLQPGDLFTGVVGNGGLQLVLAGLFMAVTMGVVWAGVRDGIERVARLFLPVLFGILILLLVSALSMDGAGEALAYIFAPRFSELDVGGVLEALGHSFFTLSLGMGAMITYGSYVGRQQSIVRASLLIVVLDTVIALFATIIMFSVIFSVPGMDEQVGRSAAGMLFISLPELFYTVVPAGRLLAPMFYLLVGLAALTSTISLLEVVVTALIDELGWSRPKATSVAGGSIFVFTFLAALSLGAVAGLSGFEIFEGKAGFFNTMDHLASNWQLPTGGFLITLAAGWFMTRDATHEELIDDQTPGWFKYGAWRFFIRFVAPVAVAAILVAVIFLGMDFT